MFKRTSSVGKPAARAGLLLQLLLLAAALNPLLSGLPYFGEYLWNYLTTLWDRTWN